MSKYDNPEYHGGEVITPDNHDLACWPDHWPWYKQMCFGGWDDRCDMSVGPCACGAWHQPREFEYHEGKLYRYGEEVPTRREQT